LLTAWSALMHWTVKPASGSRGDAWRERS